MYLEVEVFLYTSSDRKFPVLKTLMANFKFIVLLFFFSLLLLSCKRDTNDKELNHKFTNALINETSPYLLQHAHNPVDWKSWSPEAFEEAKKENKLVLLSIGYSSCHWCHVMEEETFEDEEVAKLMNKSFINIKVDREERPDVDHIYQTAIQLTKGAGGWPLNAVILPDGKPVYLDTYHSKEQWMKVLTQFSEQYVEDSEKMEAYASILTKGIQDENFIRPATDLHGFSTSILQKSVENWKANWDLEWGGEIEVEKFITPTKLEFLLSYAIITGDEEVRSHVKNTLNKIAMGGIYDHIGGGFFRYSTDAQWKIPHYEKMLYDNAQLLGLYSKAYRVFKEPAYKRIAMETFAFMEQEMKDSGGAYYAALDANSDGKEGHFYLWKEEELKSILAEDFQLFSRYYSIKTDQDLNNEGFVLYKNMDDAEFIQQNSMLSKDLAAKILEWKKLLIKYRKKRVHPQIDDKIITSWNSLAINGLLEAYKTFGDEIFLDRAENTFQFLKEKSLIGGQLIHTYKKGSRRVDVFLEDFAFLANAALNLYSTTLQIKYLNFAEDINQSAIDQFQDEDSDLFRYSTNDELISKVVKTADGYFPSSNSVIAHNLFQLGHIQYNMEKMNRAKSMLSSILPNIQESGQHYANWSSLLLNITYPYYEIAVVGKDARLMIKKFNEKYITNVLLVGSENESDLPLFRGRWVVNDTYIYVCQSNTCKLPVDTVEEAISQMGNF